MFNIWTPQNSSDIHDFEVQKTSVKTVPLLNRFTVPGKDPLVLQYNLTFYTKPMGPTFMLISNVIFRLKSLLFGFRGWLHNSINDFSPNRYQFKSVLHN